LNDGRHLLRDLEKVGSLVYFHVHAVFLRRFCDLVDADFGMVLMGLTTIVIPVPSLALALEQRIEVTETRARERVTGILPLSSIHAELGFVHNLISIEYIQSQILYELSNSALESFCLPKKVPGSYF
jgi:hypothetical protein